MKLSAEIYKEVEIETNEDVIKVIAKKFIHWYESKFGELYEDYSADDLVEMFLQSLTEEKKE